MQQCYLFLSWLEFCCMTHQYLLLAGIMGCFVWGSYNWSCCGRARTSLVVDTHSALSGLQLGLEVLGQEVHPQAEFWKILPRSSARREQREVYCPAPCRHWKELRHPAERAAASHSHFLYCAFPRRRRSDPEHLCTRWLVIRTSASRWCLFVLFVHFKIEFSFPSL